MNSSITAIEFADWIFANCDKYVEVNGVNVWIYNNKSYTTIELYNLYLDL